MTHAAFFPCLIPCSGQSKVDIATCNQLFFVTGQLFVMCSQIASPALPFLPLGEPSTCEGVDDREGLRGLSRLLHSCSTFGRGSRFWPGLKKGEVDLFTTQCNTHCPPWFSLGPVLCFSVTSSHSSFDRGSETGTVMGQSGTGSLISTVVCRDDLDIGGPALVVVPGRGVG